MSLKLLLLFCILLPLVCRNQKALPRTPAQWGRVAFVGVVAAALGALLALDLYV